LAEAAQIEQKTIIAPSITSFRWWAPTP